MMKVVTLATSSLRRCRHALGLRDLLRSPAEHSDFLFGFIEKRVQLKRLEGAPLSALQAASDRGDKFREYQNKARVKISAPKDAGTNESFGLGRKHDVPAKVEKAQKFSHDRQPLTEEIVIDVMGVWLYQEVTTKFNLTREICEQAQHQAKRGLLDQYRVKTTSTSLNRLIRELRPGGPFTDNPDLINGYAGWLLEVLLALRQKPGWIYLAIGVIGRRAMQLGEKPRYDEGVASMASGSSCDSVGA